MGPDFVSFNIEQGGPRLFDGTDELDLSLSLREVLWVLACRRARTDVSRFDVFNERLEDV